MRLLANLEISFNEKNDRVCDREYGIEVRSGSVTGLYACLTHCPVLLGRDRRTDRELEAILDMLDVMCDKIKQDAHELASQDSGYFPSSRI